MIKYLTFLFCCFFSISLSAQQSTQYSLYNFNPYSFNPAFAGLNNTLVANADLRKQWVGIEGAPISQALNVHLPFYLTRGGLGFQIQNSMVGVTRNLEALLSYNQFIEISENSRLSIGISGGVIQHSFNGRDLRAPDGIYLENEFTHNDNTLSELSESSLLPSIKFGLVYKQKNLVVGISADNLLESTFDFNSANSNLGFNQVRHYYGYLMYELEVSRDLILKPSLLVKAETTELQSDISLALEFKEKFIVGSTYRGYNSNSNDAVVIELGFRANKNLSIVYAYDLGLSALKNAHSGSHEVLISYELPTKIGAGIPPPIIYNPRFL